MTTEKTTPLGRLLDTEIDYDSRSLMAAVNEYDALRTVAQAARACNEDIRLHGLPSRQHALRLHHAIIVLDTPRGKADA